MSKLNSSYWCSNGYKTAVPMNNVQAPPPITIVNMPAATAPATLSKLNKNQQQQKIKKENKVPAVPKTTKHLPK